MRSAWTAALALLTLGCGAPTRETRFPPIDEAGLAEPIRLAAKTRWPEQPRGVVVLVHGLGGNRDDVAELADSFNAHRVATLQLDLRGHGRSGGSFPHDSPARYGVSANDVRGALSWLRAQTDDSLAIVLIGLSLGGGAVIANALDQPSLRFVAWYPGLTYQRRGDSLVRSGSPSIRGLIIQGTADSNPRANPGWTSRFLGHQQEVGIA